MRYIRERERERVNVSVMRYIRERERERERVNVSMMMYERECCVWEGEHTHAELPGSC